MHLHMNPMYTYPLQVTACLCKIHTCINPGTVDLKINMDLTLVGIGRPSVKAACFSNFINEEQKHISKLMHTFFFHNSHPSQTIQQRDS